MKTNIEKAVLIIATLSLMLGVSLGMHHFQQKKIAHLKRQVEEKHVFQFKSEIFSTPFEITIDKFDKKRKRHKRKIRKKRKCKDRNRMESNFRDLEDLEIELKMLENIYDNLDFELDLELEEL